MAGGQKRGGQLLPRQVGVPDRSQEICEFEGVVHLSKTRTCIKRTTWLLPIVLAAQTVGTCSTSALAGWLEGPSEDPDTSPEVPVAMTSLGWSLCLRAMNFIREPPQKCLVDMNPNNRARKHPPQLTTHVTRSTNVSV